MRVQFYALSIFGVAMWCLIFMRLQGGFVDMKENVAKVVKNMRGVRNQMESVKRDKLKMNLAVIALL